MNRDYPLEKVRNFGIIAPIIAEDGSLRTHGSQHSSAAVLLLSSTEKLQFFRTFSINVGYLFNTK